MDGNEEVQDKETQGRGNDCPQKGELKKLNHLNPIGQSNAEPHYQFKL